MPVYRVGDRTPAIDPSAYVHPDATVIGDVTLGPESSVWPQAVLRGDYAAIRVGARTSVQDGTVVHAAPGLPTTIGDDCVVGHLAHLEGCTVENGALIGSGSVVLHEAVIGAGATVAANAVVRDGSVVPPGALAVGVPAQLRPHGSHPERIALAVSAYRQNARAYRAGLERLS